MGNSLLEEIDNVEPIHRSSTVGTRLAITDAFRSSQGALVLAGSLQAGTIRVGQRLLLLPSRETVVVKSLQRYELSSTRQC